MKSWAPRSTGSAIRSGLTLGFGPAFGLAALLALLFGVEQHSPGHGGGGWDALMYGLAAAALYVIVFLAFPFTPWSRLRGFGAAMIWGAAFGLGGFLALFAFASIWSRTGGGPDTSDMLEGALILLSIAVGHGLVAGGVNALATLVLRRPKPDPGANDAPVGATRHLLRLASSAVGAALVAIGVFTLLAFAVLEVAHGVEDWIAVALGVVTLVLVLFFAVLMLRARMESRGDAALFGALYGATLGVALFAAYAAEKIHPDLQDLVLPAAVAVGTVLLSAGIAAAAWREA